MEPPEARAAAAEAQSAAEAQAAAEAAWSDKCKSVVGGDLGSWEQVLAVAKMRQLLTLV